MKLSWRDLQKRTKAYFVHGDLIARVKGKHVVLGKKREGTVILSPQGEALSVSLASPSLKKPVETPVRRGTRKKVVTPEVTDNADAEDTKLRG